MATTAMNIDKTASTAREMAEAQRDSFEAIAENFAAAQRRSMGLAEGGLEFVRLQEQNARAAQEFFAQGVRLLKLQGRNAEFVRGWMGEAVEVVREQAEQNVRTAEVFARGVSRQQESVRALHQGWVGASRYFFRPPAAHIGDGVEYFFGRLINQHGGGKTLIVHDYFFCVNDLLKTQSYCPDMTLKGG